MATCYRHPSRETGVACSNCGRPICPDCMTTTAVGMRCPECSKQRTKVMRVRESTNTPRLTYALIAINVLAFLAEEGQFTLFGTSIHGTVINEGVLDRFDIAVEHEYWRLVSSAFLHVNILHIGFNMYLLYVLGLMLEPALGSLRFGLVYFTSLLAGRTAALLALDHSVESLRKARGKVGGLPLCGPRAIFAQADASYLPVRGGWATRVLSCQMLEHIPTPAARQRAVREMARALAPGGRLVLSAYYHPPFINRWLPKEGRHSGEIYFYRFARAELVELLGERLKLRGITGRLVYILLAHAEA